MRGSVPAQWAQDISKIQPKPPIFIETQVTDGLNIFLLGMICLYRLLLIGVKGPFQITLVCPYSVITVSLLI